MEPDLRTLTAVAATTVVELMATDGWDRAKAAVVSLWRRVHPEQAAEIGAELSAVRGEVLAARDTEDKQPELDLVSEWRNRLLRLVAADPSPERELRLLMAELRPVAAETEANRINLVIMRAKATDHGRVYQAGHDQKIVER
jgi:hypothetical protein